jgi:pilus assembly protein Flp/PilA
MLQAVVSKLVGRFVRDERGATMLEYGLLVGLVAIAAIAGMTLLGDELKQMFTDAAGKV